MDPEQQQVERAARGDEGAFQSIWTRHRDTVHRFACWMLQDATAAEDVTQDCFIALLQHPSRFDSRRGSLRTFLLGVARNQCRYRLRALTAEVELEDEAISGRSWTGWRQKRRMRF